MYRVSLQNLLFSLRTFRSALVMCVSERPSSSGILAHTKCTELICVDARLIAISLPLMLFLNQSISLAYCVYDVREMLLYQTQPLTSVCAAQIVAWCTDKKGKRRMHLPPICCSKCVVLVCIAISCISIYPLHFHTDTR